MSSRKHTGIKRLISEEPQRHPADTQDGSPTSGSAADPMTRRGFCTRLLLTSTGLLIVTTSLGVDAAQQTPLLAYPPLKVEGAERLMPGSSLYFNYPTRNDPAILVCAQDGEYYAYGQKCSHRGCSIYFDRARRCLECPCHNGAYDVQTGFVLQGPPPRPLDQIILQMRAGGEVWAVGRSIGNAERNA